ncbi:transglycosylase SLT domain-containing protein [Streptomyces sp. WMMB 322]|uniref:transglycosylase SLT domain-containing protein n=1 Tax=Streptomyces sp. WMMB 322 TaxID=1286821 RepID=UPI0006E3571C|nr:transglycosylase SLT domain-containing protein [Streptomyces sp. WMMB 322]SCK34925.1 Transglycosylase SLT domain-containing protein [Streptomyces sp. WMMB 322]
MRIPNRLTRTQKSAAVGLAAAAGVATLTAGAASAHSDTTTGQGPAKPVASHSVNVAGHPSSQAAKAATGDHDTDNTRSHAPAKPLVKGEASKQTSAAKPAAEADKAQKTDKAEKAEKAEQTRKAQEARADRTAERSTAGLSKSEKVDVWIKEARSIMKKEGIPGSHHGIKKNVMRESGGDPNAMNDWDINAKKGTPSKGLLQTIQPTFDAYHVDGTKKKITDPVANIVAACNYAADKYGSMDNVNSAY